MLLMKKKTVFKTFLIYYEVLFGIMFLIAVCICSYMLKTMENEIHDVYNRIIVQAGSQVDNEIASYRKLVMELSTRPEIGALASNTARLDNSQRWEMVKVQEILRLPIINDSSIKQIYIFFPTKNYILSNNGYSDINDFYNNYLKEAFPSQGEWTRFLSENNLSNIYQRGGCLQFVITLPMDSLTKRDAVLCMVVDPAVILERLNAAKDDYQTSVAIADNEGNFITSNESNVDLIRTAVFMKSQDASLRGGQNIIVGRTNSEVDGWQYISVVSKRELLKNALAVRNVIVGIFILSILLGFIISWILSKKNVKPILRIQNERDNIAFELSQYKQGIWEQYIQKLLKGYPLSTLPQGFGFASQLMELDDAWKVIMLIPIEESEKEVVFPVKDETYKQIHIVLDDYLCLILLFSENVESSYIYGICKEIENILLENNGLYEGHSVAFRQRDMFPVALDQAREMLMEKQLLGSGQDLPESGGGQTVASGVSIHELLKLHNAIQSCKYSEAERIFDDISVSSFYGGSGSAQMVRCNMFAVTNVFIAALFHNASPEEKDEISARLLKCVSVAQYTKEVKDILAMLDKQAKETQNKNKQNYRDAMEQVLLDHYRDPSFSVAMMAEQFKIDPSSLSRKYKQLNHINLLERIHQLRIEEAKRLLVQSGLTIHEISGMVGYNSELTFLRSFKKQEGMTPSKYREINA